MNCGIFHLLLYVLGCSQAKSRLYPRPKVGTSKYGPAGLYNEKSFRRTGLSLVLCQQLANLANHSLSKSTWSSYKTVSKHLERCQKDLDFQFRFPMTNEQVLWFTAWLVKRGVQGVTINSYISGLRALHLVKGIEPPALRLAIVSAIID